jgi:hypothetical protein
MRSLFRSAKPRNKTIYSVIRDTQADETLEILSKILGCGAEGGKSAGIAFLLPIEKAIGI